MVLEHNAFSVESRPSFSDAVLNAVQKDSWLCGKSRGCARVSGEWEHHRLGAESDTCSVAAYWWKLRSGAVVLGAFQILCYKTLWISIETHHSKKFLIRLKSFTLWHPLKCPSKIWIVHFRKCYKSVSEFARGFKIVHLPV